MFESETVFIVGAGASSELNFPTGEELKQLIYQSTDLTVSVFNEVEGRNLTLWKQIEQRYGSERKNYFDAARCIRTGVRQRNSIDEFLDWHSSSEQIQTYAKAEIVWKILEAEKSALDQHFMRNEKNTLPPSTKCFHPKLFALLMAGRRKEDVEKTFENVKFIIFNYDRCLEHYFIQALQTQQISEDTAIEICSQSGVFYHTYGSIAPLTGENSIPFGGGHGYPNYVDLSRNIKTFSERDTDGSYLDEMREVVACAINLVFLGFSFSKPNMEVLAIRELTTASKVFGTAKMPQPNISALEMELQTQTHSDVYLCNEDCTNFFDEYRIPLSRI